MSFDPLVISDDIILDVFSSLHDPRQRNRQGADVGTSYRPAMIRTDGAQKSSFWAAVEHVSEYWNGGLVTTLEPLVDWHRAKSYHRDFFAGNLGRGNCMAVALPTVDRFRTSFATCVLAS